MNYRLFVAVAAASLVTVADSRAQDRPSSRLSVELNVASAHGAAALWRVAGELRVVAGGTAQHSSETRDLLADGASQRTRTTTTSYDWRLGLRRPFNVDIDDVLLWLGGGYTQGVTTNNVPEFSTRARGSYLEFGATRSFGKHLRLGALPELRIVRQKTESRFATPGLGIPNRTEKIARTSWRADPFRLIATLTF